MATQFPLSNVINISVSQTPTGVNAYNTSNIGLFTHEEPDDAFADGYKIYLEPTEVGVDFGTSSVTYDMAVAMFSQQPNMLLPSGYLVIMPLAGGGSETLDDAIIRMNTIVQFFGVMSTQVETQSDMLAAAATLQALNKMGFFVQTASGSVSPGGSLDLLRSGGFTHSRGLFYSDNTDNAALKYQAAYAARGLSTVFTGSNTTQDIHLKQLATIQPDPDITQTLLTNAKAAGADVYVSVQGFSAVLASGENSFFDQIYNLLWLTGAMQVAGFNFLASANTKVPQTEIGMDALKGAYRAVCQQAVANQYVAPGSWNSALSFGNQADLIRNIQEFGYYIYSTPIAFQSQADRAERKSPVIQIALKEAGSINSSTIIVNVNP